MRICEVRKYLEDFIVFVNMKEDIKVLKKDSRFRQHAQYTDTKTNKLWGAEFGFKGSSKTLKAAKRYVEEVLHDSRSKKADSRCKTTDEGV